MILWAEYANDNNKVLMHFSIEEIEKGVNDLNLRRAGGRNDLSIDYVIYAHPIIYHHLCGLFAIIIKHGHVPDDFKHGVIIPVIKHGVIIPVIKHGIIIPVIKDNRKGLGDVDNYRLLLLYLFFLSYLKFACIIKLIVV